MKQFKNIYLIYGKSGSGKSALVHRLQQDYPDVQALQSYTTRPRRSPDEEGHTFVTNNQFKQLKDIVAETDFDGYKYAATLKQLLTTDMYVIDCRGIKNIINNEKGLLSQGLLSRIRLLYVYADPNERKARLIDRDGIDRGCKRFQWDEDHFHYETRTECGGEIYTSSYRFVPDHTIYNMNGHFKEAYAALLQYIQEEETSSKEYERKRELSPYELRNHKIYYISHPFGNKPENLTAIENIVGYLQKLEPDAIFLSPCHTFGFQYTAFPDYFEGAKRPLTLLSMCNEMLVFGDYNSSVGCNLEIDYCQSHDIPYRIMGNIPPDMLPEVI